GGGWTGGDTGTWERSAPGTPVMGDYFTRKLGVAVAGVAWRSSSNSEGTFTKATNDISLAVAYATAHANEYGLDTRRMGLYGGSAGTPTSALVAQNNTNISCYIGFNGLYNFVHRTGTGSFGDGTSFAQDVPSYEANSAALNIRTNNPPDTLLLHGSADTTIEPEQSIWYADGIRAAGGSAKVLVYRDEVHAFFNAGKPMYYPTMHAAAQHLIRVFNLDVHSMPDVNGNAIPDEWEALWSTEGLVPENDDDHDGLSNWQEYILGSNPEDPSSTMKTALLATTDWMQLTFPTVEATGPGYRGLDRLYQIEGCTNLLDPAWVLYQTMAATNGTGAYTNNPLSDAGFYRVRAMLH
ncbi:MAG: prolyl oligopeptidase family serine peptidase, partial [Kiritimatiellales bacterium]|nr:prolyl oligopeptidase family serine peptidase [Kiritimatiellales bacterium]